MEKVFACVLSLSLSGAVTGIGLLLVHPLTKKCLSKKWNYYIWLLVAVRLMIPVHIEMPNSIQLPVEPIWEKMTGNPAESMALPTREAAFGAAEEILPLDGMDETEKPAVQQSASSSQASALGQSSPVLHRPSDTGKKISTAAVLGMIWLLGAAAALLVKIKNYRRFHRYIQEGSNKITDFERNSLTANMAVSVGLGKIPAVWESERILTPITVGLLKPCIVLPKQRQDTSHLSLILHHELVHVKRGDLWYKWLFQLLLCIHWFNPVLYLVGNRINRDCELACDEAVLAALNPEGRKAYGNALINAAEQNMKSGRNIPSMTLVNRKENLKERLKGILRYKKQGRGKMILSVVAAFLMIFLSACGSVEVARDAMPLTAFREAGEEETEEGFSRPKDGHMSLGERLISSLLHFDVDDFLAMQRTIDKKGKPWQVYEDDELLAGKDVEGQWAAFFYSGDGKTGAIEGRGMFMNGSDSILITQAVKETEIEMESSFDLLEGRYKIVHVKPDKTVETLVEEGEKKTTLITLEEGRNVIKMVGQGCKLKNLNIRFRGQTEGGSLETIYYSEAGEYADLVWDDIREGTADKKRIFDTMIYMDKEQVSKLFVLMLEQGVSLNAEELQEVFIYSDPDLSLEYLTEAVESGEIKPLTKDQVMAILPYTATGERGVLFQVLKENMTFEVLEESMPYLDDGERTELISWYIEQGNTLSYSEFAELAPYLSQQTIKEIDRLRGT